MRRRLKIRFCRFHVSGFGVSLVLKQKMIRRLWIPTSHSRLLKAQNRLLDHFVDSSLIDLKSYSVSVDENGMKMNVVEVS